jgi:hypothetical protein
MAVTTVGGYKDFANHPALITKKDGVFYGSPEYVIKPIDPNKPYPNTYRLVRPQHPPLAPGVVDPVLEEAFGKESSYEIEGHFSIKGPELLITAWKIIKAG